MYLDDAGVARRARLETLAAARTREWLPLGSWIAALALAVALLVLMGRGEGLRSPSILAPGAWPAWAVGRDPLVVAFALLRLVGLACAWYLLGVTTVGLVARLCRWGRLVRAADMLTVPWVRRLLQTALGLGLAAAAVTAATAAPGTARPPAAQVAMASAPRRLEPPPLDLSAPPVLPPAIAPAPDAAGPVLPPAIAPAPEAGGPVSPAIPPAPEAAAPMLPPAIAPAPVPETGGEYEVLPGDHFWSIAEQALAQRWGRIPSDAEIAPFWRDLVALNRARLVDPGNPDLILPGQRLTVPAPPPAP